ncbi:uncharacterized protein LOC128553487 [Mercenaria mercenaria]|uniref:uncharacterized protein LOC128553487 n=1 Tax=Mercenaria mercenaria TaxID=6596 RepID=UPI00234E843E|nr:uncharacterized protein LOC128553487 [Mercenaria mercenaria]
MLTVYRILQYLKVFRNSKMFAQMKSPMKKNYFCKHCLMSVEIEMKVCPNTFCKKDISDDSSKSYFIEFPIEDQIKCMFKRKSFRENLKHRFSRKKQQENAFEDLYDGFIYKSLLQPEQPLSNLNNLSFTWNTDGVPVFKSSKYSIWPMYLMINELPYSARKEKTNMLFYGLWFGDLKPSINLFCKPLQDSLKKLETDGLDVKFEGRTENVKCFLLCGTADLPARSTALNMIQFNGKYSCSRCLQEGETFKTSARGHTHIFPYLKDNPVGPPRSHIDTIQHAVEATEGPNEFVKGIRGPTFLLGLSYYDFVLSTSIDYMHCVLLGITKKLISLWFSVGDSSELFSLVSKVGFVDDCMSKIKPTFHISRRPRSLVRIFILIISRSGSKLGHMSSKTRSLCQIIEKTTSYSKLGHVGRGERFRTIMVLLFYSVPVLSTIMEPLYFFHYCAFVQSIWLLCQDSVSNADIDVSYSLLNYFVYMLEPLYGARYSGLNAHSLLHLPKCVQDLGPLWVYSCFPFESLNGDLLKLFHGTQHVDTQILSAVNSHQLVPHLLEKLSDNVKHIPFVKKYLNKSKIALGLKLDHNIYSIGTNVKFKLSGSLLRLLTNFLKFKLLCLSFFSLLKVRNNIIHSESYTRVKERNSFTVKFLDRNNIIQFGFIKIFVVHRFSECACNNVCVCDKQILAIITKLKKVKGSILDKNHEEYPDYLNLNVGHIHVMETPKNLESEIIQVHNIVSICVDVCFSDIDFVCEFPNITECD